LPGIGAQFKLKDPDNHCTNVAFGAIPGNPPVRFEAGIAPGMIVQLDNAADIQPVDADYFSRMTPPVQLIQSSNDLTDAVCDSVTMGSGRVTEVHALYQNEFYVHDPRFDLEDNTLSAPLQDGGGAILEETKSSVFHHSSSCANVPRSFLNEEFCFMSTRLDACGDLQSPGITGEFGKYVH
jgi:hypothetical protein